MKQAYIKEIVHTASGAADDYTYDDKVEPGKVLVVRDICAWFSAIASTEEAHFFIEDGGNKKYLGEDAPVDTGGHPHWSGEVVIGEGDRVGVYIPDSTTDDEIHLFIFGVLWDIEDWRKSLE